MVKLPLAQFPVSVGYPIANAMIAKLYLGSSLSTAKLVARISLDENVMQAAGELQGEISWVQADKLITEIILINKAEIYVNLPLRLLIDLALLFAARVCSQSSRWASSAV